MRTLPFFIVFLASCSDFGWTCSSKKEGFLEPYEYKMDEVKESEMRLEKLMNIVKKKDTEIKRLRELLKHDIALAVIDAKIHGYDINAAKEATINSYRISTNALISSIKEYLDLLKEESKHLEELKRNRKMLLLLNRRDKHKNLMEFAKQEHSKAIGNKDKEKAAILKKEFRKWKSLYEQDLSELSSGKPKKKSLADELFGSIKPKKKSLADELLEEFFGPDEISIPLPEELYPNTDNLYTPSPPAQIYPGCCKRCRPPKSCACGNSCISCSYNCKKGVGCACNY